MSYLLLEHFQSIFQGQVYRHRASGHGDAIARRFYEDLYALSRSPILKDRVDSSDHVINLANTVVGRKGRRGDGTFGEGAPYGETIREPGFNVALGDVANLEIAIEVKVLQKAMIKQIDRVQGDLAKQVEIFKSKNHRAITIGFVAVNHAKQTTSYEGDREFIAHGSAAPSIEGPKAIARLQETMRKYDEMMFLKFKITNVYPFPFQWVNAEETSQQYGSLLVRVLRNYEARFTT
jgi:hypothetical protein